MSSSSSSKRNKTNNGPSDSDVDKTYTGLDRELAEEFIEQTMDPAIVLSSRSLNSGSKNNNKSPYRPERNASVAAASSSALQSPNSQQTASGTALESEA